MNKEEVINKAIELEFGSGNAKSIRAHNSSLVKVAEHLYDLMQPSLPSNLDEAAERMAWNIAPDYPDISWDTCFEKIKAGIKAGAELMAGQGVEAKVLQVFTDGSAYIECPYEGRSGDKVVVQIRKKEE